MKKTTKAKSRELRKNLTEAERTLWKHLRFRQFVGHKFRRQQPLGRYIVDFVCLEKKLIVEVDGGQHSEQVTYDAERTTWLEAQGFRILRFWNNEVLQNTEVVKEVIAEALNHEGDTVSTPSPLSGGRLGWGGGKRINTPHPSPPPQGGRGKERRDNELTGIIKSLIRKCGAITFAEFMELALYHPEYGYYCGGRAEIGKEGDYYTSPYAHSAFGEIIGRFVCRACREIDTPNFTVVEMGAGKGLLALDILDSVKRNRPEIYDRMEYSIVELSASLRKEGKNTLKEHLNKVEWADSISRMQAQSLRGVFISNELVDSFPFHRARFKDGKLFEIFVALEEDEFVETLREPVSPLLREYFEGYGPGFEDGQGILHPASCILHPDYGLEFADGQGVEVNLKPREWLCDVSRILDRGFILTTDYGCTAPELYSPIRMNGTFRCFYKHTINESPYTNIGEQDITAHVDFSNLVRVGESLGLHTLKYASQGQFLVDWGVLDIIERYSGEGSENDLSAGKSRMAIKNLFLPGLMGERFKVLIQGKNMEETGSFYPESPFRISRP